MLGSLLQYIREQFPSAPAAIAVPNELTVGVEHELFLLRHGAPCTHEESQKFLKKLAQRPGWHIRSSSETNYGRMIDRVSLEDEGGSYTAVKYDHHPHQLEIAFAYRKSALELASLVSRVLEVFYELADSLDLQISKDCILNVSPSDPSVVSELPVFKNLRHYRSRLLERGPFRREWRRRGFENYASVIAATQTHIGGTRWWSNPGLINSLYTLEPQVLSWVALFRFKDSQHASKLLLERWAGYQAVFYGKPLVGFPDLNEWTLQSWAGALLNSPMCGGESDPFASMSIREIGRNPLSDWESFFKEVRDLQIIRPRLFGTLEFRADPAQEDASGIAALSALRLGICSYYLSARSSSAGFVSARREWWDIVNSGISSPSVEILSNAVKGLEMRKMGEEILLSKFMALGKLRPTRAIA